MLKLYLYGCLNRVRSSRRLAAEAARNLELIWLLRGVRPDFRTLAPTAGAAREVLGVERIDAVADRGYHKGEDIEACEADGITPYVPRPHRGSAIANGHFPKERFRYDGEADVCHCSGGQILDTRYRSVTRGHVSIQYSNPGACAGCQMKAECTAGRWRRINRREREDIIARMAERLAKRPDILVIRRSTAEHPFGTIKQSMNQGAFLMRGLENVRAEFSLTALASLGNSESLPVITRPTPV